MQLTSHASNQDLTSEIDKLCDSTSTSYALADKVRRINIGLEELVAEIINADGIFEYDDTNQSDLPVGTGNLIASQSSYAFASEYLQIRQVKVKDANGNWLVLKQIDYRDFVDIAIEESFADTGMPTHFDILGDNIKLYPAPVAANVTLTAGLKVHFTRTASLFTTSDTTKEPGLPSPYHVLLAYMAAIPYCAVYKKDRVAWLEKKVVEGKASLIKFFSKRNKDERRVMTMKGFNFI